MSTRLSIYGGIGYAYGSFSGKRSTALIAPLTRTKTATARTRSLAVDDEIRTLEPVAPDRTKSI